MIRFAGVPGKTGERRAGSGRSPFDCHSLLNKAMAAAKPI
jgi:hypothetical protein